jgi:hypothetical protein
VELAIQNLTQADALLLAGGGSLLQCQQIEGIEELIGGPIEIALSTKKFVDFLSQILSRKLG